MPCFPLSGYNILPKQELHRSLQTTFNIFVVESLLLCAAVAQDEAVAVMGSVPRNLPGVRCDRCESSS